MAARKQTISGPRIDPVPRRVDGVSGWLELENKDPRRHYVLAYDLDTLCGRAYLASLGYQVEKRVEGGVHFKNGEVGQMGEPLMWRGHVLMSIDQETRAQIDADGARWADHVENRIVDRDQGVQDLLRGIRGRFMKVTNHTSVLSPDSVFEE